LVVERRGILAIRQHRGTHVLDLRDALKRLGKSGCAHQGNHQQGVDFFHGTGSLQRNGFEMVFYFLLNSITGY
jgi:hypothetical protein